jgi:hypothetical protein
LLHSSFEALGYLIKGNSELLVLGFRKIVDVLTAVVTKRIAHASILAEDFYKTAILELCTEATWSFSFFH